jgi:general secretion pathway protein C
VSAGPDASEQVVAPKPAKVGEAIAELHLFGQPGRMTVASLTDSRDLPQTTLQLDLSGVIYSTSPTRSVAIIREKDNKADADPYGVGDSLPGNAVLTEIHPDRVILRRNGIDETLSLSDESSLALTLDIPENKTPRVPVQKRMGGKKHRPPIRPGGDGASLNIDREYLNHYLANPNSLASQIGVDVYEVGGKQQGYQLQAGNGSKLLDQLGLQSGDVLTEVNGMPLKSDSDAMLAYVKAKNAEKVQVQFVRDGKPQTREFTIDQL